MKLSDDIKIGFSSATLSLNASGFAPERKLTLDLNNGESGPTLAMTKDEWQDLKAKADAMFRMAERMDG
jgi:hypothetical protein